MNEDKSLATTSDTLFDQHYLISTLWAHMNLEDRWEGTSVAFRPAFIFVTMMSRCHELKCKSDMKATLCCDDVVTSTTPYLLDYNFCTIQTESSLEPSSGNLPLLLCCALNSLHCLEVRLESKLACRMHHDIVPCKVCSLYSEQVEIGFCAACPTFTIDVSVYVCVWVGRGGVKRLCVLADLDFLFVSPLWTILGKNYIVKHGICNFAHKRCKLRWVSV